MTAPLPPNAVNPACFSQTLLDHDGLMTPVLVAQFGPLTVRQTEARHSETRFFRRSSIYQAASGAKILDAVLDISLPSLPLGFLAQLQDEDVLFGQLLSDFSIAVRIADRVLYQSHSRWGRRLTIYHSDTQAFICTVEELMAPDAQLWPLRLAV